MKMVQPMTYRVLSLLPFLFFLHIQLLPTGATTTYNVVALGAKGDGKSDSTMPFLSAWDSACGSDHPATVYVPPGTYLLGKTMFSGPCKNGDITFRIDGTLVAPSDYRVLGNAANWLIFDRVSGVSVYGGTLDGQGTGLWACKRSGQNCPTGATTLEFSNSNNIFVSGLTSHNSQMFHIVINNCNNVKVQGAKVSASRISPNTDGIHVSSSSGVMILNSRIGTGDDCISIGPGTTNLWIQNIACGPGHGISIGSLGKDLNEAGVQNVTVNTVTFTGTKNGVRIKTWAKPSSAFVRGVLFQHATMVNVQNPIIISQNYCPDNKNCPRQVSGVRISDVTYQDIHGSSATEVAVEFDCSKEYPCSGITLEDVNLTYENKAAEASCVNAGGSASGLVKPSSCF
ncbi:polygalacturonase-like [Actinidia eriantha]|uniref:polygalacturonase-like n=1 Tax=Actinidia eriantha TaxID=165200 RepID=UPI00258AA3E3|nr:polygalacturonase-like [Actinidia eriantha]